MKKLLDQANTALKKGKLEAALGLLLKAWRKKRSPELADLIDCVSEACSARLQSLPPRLATDDFGAWRELCWERRPEDFERLIAVKLPRKSGQVLRMVEALYRWADDPRVARFCSSLLRDQALFSKGRDAERRFNTDADIYRSIASHLVELRDSRSADALASMSFVPKDFPWLKAREAEAFGRVAVKLSVSEQKQVRQLSAAFPTKRARAPGRSETKALLVQIYERPGDLSARAVYADALLEQGDPRGEFIALQLSASRDLQREAAWLRKHEALSGDSNF